MVAVEITGIAFEILSALFLALQELSGTTLERIRRRVNSALSFWSESEFEDRRATRLLQLGLLVSGLLLSSAYLFSEPDRISEPSVPYWVDRTLVAIIGMVPGVALVSASVWLILKMTLLAIKVIEIEDADQAVNSRRLKAVGFSALTVGFGITMFSTVTQT